MSQNKNKLFWRRALTGGLSQLFAFIVAIIFFFTVYRFGSIMKFVSKMCSILMPVIIGIVIAYLIHPIVEKVESGLEKLWKKISKKEMKKKAFRMPAILISLLALAGILFLLIYMVVPQLYSNISRIIFLVPGQVTIYYNKLQKIVIDNAILQEWVTKVYENVMDFLTGWVKKEMLDQVSMVFEGIVSVVGALSNFIIGIIVAIYLLLSKETFARHFSMILDAFFSQRTNAKIREILRESDKIFGGFISGKIIDSLIIGILCFIGALILRLPYAPLISVIIGFTNIIPFFGPYIGAIPSAILVFLESPTKGVIFLIFILILQQFDGNILGPRILGESTGLSPFWVLFAILVGSGLFGIVGMIIGVPAFGVIYYLIKDFIHYRLSKRREVECEKK